MISKKFKKPPIKHLAMDFDERGNARIYFRKSGQRKVRLRATPYDSAGEIRKEFMDEYFAALEGKTTSLPKLTKLEESSFNWLLNKYMNDPKFKQLDRVTQRDKLGVLGRFCETAGELPYRSFRREDVKRSQAKRIETPGAADKLVKYLRAWFNWAIENDLAEHNPALGVRYINTGSEGWHTWTPDEILQYEEHHKVGTKARLALGLVMYTGVRVSDLARLGRQFESGNILSFVEFKYRNRKPKRADIPMLGGLKSLLAASPTGDLTYIVTERGSPYTKESLANLIKDWCRDAGLPHCSVHGMRKASATILAERGATTPQLCAIFGWTKLDTAERYIRKANKKVMALKGLTLLEQEQMAAEIIPLSGHAKDNGTK